MTVDRAGGGAVSRARPGGRCERCGYDLASFFHEHTPASSPGVLASHAPLVRCPECGQLNTPPWPGPMPPTLALALRILWPSLTSLTVGGVVLIAALLLHPAARPSPPGPMPLVAPMVVMLGVAAMLLSMIWAAELLRSRLLRQLEPLRHAIYRLTGRSLTRGRAAWAAAAALAAPPLVLLAATLLLLV